MRSIRFSTAALVLLGFSAPPSFGQDAAPRAEAAASSSAEPGWALRLPKDNAVVFHGVANFDAAGSGAQGMMYPAVGGLAGMLVAVATHSAIQGTINNSERQRILTQADQVLQPYHDVLKDFTHRDLMTLALQSSEAQQAHALLDSTDTTTAMSAGTWVVESSPTYLLTQDQQSLILENAISISEVGNGKPFYQNIVRVVSRPYSGENVREHWTTDAGAPLKSLSASLMTISLQAAATDAQKKQGGTDSTGPGKTVRYPEGGNEKVERGQVLETRCERVLIKTLRGWLMSVPTRQPSPASDSSAACLVATATSPK